LEEGVEEAAGEEGAVGGPGGLAGVDHLLGTFEQVGEMHVGAAFLGGEAGGLCAVVVGVAPGDGPFVDGVGPEDAGTEAIAIVDDKKDGVGRPAPNLDGFCADLLDGLAGGEGLVLEAGDGLVEKLAVEESIAAGLPDGVAFEAADLLDAGFAPGVALLATFYETLDDFEGVEAVGVERAVGSGDDFFERAAALDIGFGIAPQRGE